MRSLKFSGQGSGRTYCTFADGFIGWDVSGHM